MFTLDYLKIILTKQLTVFKNMTIILVEIVRMTVKIDHLSVQHFMARAGGFAPEVTVAAIGRPKMAYLDVEKKIS